MTGRAYVGINQEFDIVGNFSARLRMLVAVLAGLWRSEFHTVWPAPGFVDTRLS